MLVTPKAIESQLSKTAMRGFDTQRVMETRSLALQGIRPEVTFIWEIHVKLLLARTGREEGWHF